MEIRVEIVVDVARRSSMESAEFNYFRLIDITSYYQFVLYHQNSILILN